MVDAITEQYHQIANIRHVFYDKPPQSHAQETETDAENKESV